MTTLRRMLQSSAKNSTPRSVSSSPKDDSPLASAADDVEEEEVTTTTTNKEDTTTNKEDTTTTATTETLKVKSDWLNADKMENSTPVVALSVTPKSKKQNTTTTSLSSEGVIGSRRASSTTSIPPAVEQQAAITEPPLSPIKKQEIFWVQCEQCQKWRKLPPHVDEIAEDEVWTCVMNTWKVGGGSCEDPEDKEDTILPVPPVIVLPPVPPPVMMLNSQLPPGINLYGTAFLLPTAAKSNHRIVSYRDLITNHYRNNKTFNPHYDHICDERYKGFSAYTSVTCEPVQPKPRFPSTQDALKNFKFQKESRDERLPLKKKLRFRL